VSKAQADIPPLRQIYLYLAGACNLKCRHCWIDPEYATRLDRFLPIAELTEIVRQALPLGLKNVKITGGEPFLHPELCRILADLRSMGLSLTMETNGTLIGEPEAQALADAQVRLSVSLDGPNARLHEHLRGVRGSFDQTLKGIENLRRVGLGFQIIISLYQNNRDCLPEMARFARELGANSLKVNPIHIVARSERMSDRGELLSVGEVLAIYRDLKNSPEREQAVRIIFDVPHAFLSLKDIGASNTCTCGIHGILGVLHDGRGGVCGIGEHVKELDFGNLLEQGVKKVWEENEILQTIRAKVPNELQGICRRCMLKQYCLGKCVAHTYYHSQNVFSGFPFCEEAFEQDLFPATRLLPG
jgi:SynChlorMet cassette radical SAM/SPASM protein ScmF